MCHRCLHCWELDNYGMFPAIFSNLWPAFSARNLQWPLGELIEHEQSIYIRYLWLKLTCLSAKTKSKQTSVLKQVPTLESLNLLRENYKSHFWTFKWHFGVRPNYISWLNKFGNMPKCDLDIKKTGLINIIIQPERC